MSALRTSLDVDDVTAVDFDGLASALKHGSVALAVDAGDLAAVRDGLLSAGVEGSIPVAITGDGTGETQYTTISTVDSFVAAALGFTNRVVVIAGAEVSNVDKLGWWERRPLYGWRVLVPRTKEQAGVMSARLRAYGAIPCEVPTIAVEPPRTPAQMERAIKGLVDGRYAWAIFTSANAVRAVWEKFAEHGLDARHFGGVKIACIGEATAEAVRAFGIQPELVPSGDQSSEGLLAEFAPYDEIFDPVGRVLLPRADIATETLAGRSHRARLGGRRRHRLPHRPGRPSAGGDSQRHQVRWFRRRALHLIVDRAQSRRHRRQAASAHRCLGDRAEDRRNGGRIRSAGGCPARARFRS